MSLPVIIYVLTALAAVVVVLTRMRMRGGQGAGRVFVGKRLLDLHTGFGVAARGWILQWCRPATALPSVPSTWNSTSSSRWTRTAQDEFICAITGSPPGVRSRKTP